MSVERRFSRGIQFGVAYTLSRTKDDASSLTEVLPNAFDGKGYYGISDNDRPHVLILNYIYEFPFFNKSTNKLVRSMLGGWELSGENQWQSSGLISIREGVDYAGVGPGSGTQFWKVTGDPAAVTRTEFTSFAVWFNKDAFARPDLRTFAPFRRNILRNPGFYNWDLGLRKNFAVTEKQKLQFRFEMFNVLNHPNWGGANSNPISGAFGQVTAKSGERQLQLAIKYIF